MDELRSPSCLLFTTSFCSGRFLFLGDLIRAPSKLFAGNAPELL